MDVARWAQYFNDVAVEVHRKTVGVVKPGGAWRFVNQGTPTGDCIDWTWRICEIIPEDVVAGVGLTLKPDPMGLGFEVVLTAFIFRGEERLNQLGQIYWARFIDLKYLQYDVKYNNGKFKRELISEVAFQIQRAYEHVKTVASRLGEIPANKEKIKQEMKILNFTLHRAK